MRIVNNHLVDFEKLKFWDHGAELWDPVINVGLRSHYIAACHAAKAMTKQRNGLIINISSLGADKYMFFTAYGVGKAGVDRMTQDMAQELKVKTRSQNNHVTKKT